MEYRAFKKSGLKVTPIAFGAWAIGGWLWGGADRKKAIEGIHRSRDLGITTIDTAPVYGFGRSEEIVGEAIKGEREKYEILTKCGLRWDTQKGVLHFETKDFDGNTVGLYKYSGKESIIEECENSLKRLGTDYLDLLQIHWPDTSTPIEESMEAFDKLLKDGKIRAAGVSNYSLEQMQRANSVIPLNSNQVPFSMIRRDINEDVVPYALENDIGIIAYSPMERGLLTGKITMDYKFNEGDNRPQTRLFQPENRKRILEFIDELKPIAEEKGATIPQLVISWTLEQPGITCALVGARNAQQAEQNAKALEIKLNAEDLRKINEAIARVDEKLAEVAQ